MQIFQKVKISLRVPLFWKFAIGLTIMAMLLGSINIALVYRIIYMSLGEELQQKGLSISKMISQNAAELLLYDDFVALNRLVDDIKEVDSSIEYIFILNRDNKIIAHTFKEGVPKDLLSINRIETGSTLQVVPVKPKGKKIGIRDIAIPLFEGKVGVVRVGLTEEYITRTLKQAISLILVMILVFFIIGIVGIFLFSYMVTSPVQSISKIAERIDLKSIKEKRINFAVRYPNAIERTVGILPNDELDTLVAKFNEMVFRLEQAYDEVEQAHKKLIQSEKLASIGTLASGVAHEVNNPLAGILHCIDRLKRRPDDLANNKKLLDLMEDAANKVEAVVSNLLNFARQSDNKFEEILFTDIITNSLMLVSHRLEKEQIEVKENHKKMNVKVFGIKNQLEQVVVNILINSADAIAERKGVNAGFRGLIELYTEQNEGFLYFSIIDNGIGISNERIGKVLDPFYTSKSVGKGTGLGLSISLNIIEEHGGDMEISSDGKAGTKVEVRLPLA